MLAIQNVRTPLQLLLLSRREDDAVEFRALLADGGEHACELAWHDITDETDLEALDNCDTCLMVLEADDRKASGWLFRAGRDGPPVIVIGDDIDPDTGLFAASPAVADLLPRAQLGGLLLSRSIRYALSQRAADERIAALAMHDEDTGLYSPPLFWEMLEQGIRRAARNKSALAVMMLRVEPSGKGQAPARNAYIEIGRKLRESLRARDTVARFNETTFGIVVEGLEELAAIHIVTEKLTDAVRDTLVEGADAPFECSLGIAIYPKSGENASSLVQHASEILDSALSGDATNFHFG